MNQLNSPLQFSLVVAIDSENGIGKNNTIPWQLKGDMQYFRELTTKTEKQGTINAVIMGRKTWDSLPERFKPLPERLNIIISRSLELNEDFVQTVLSLDSALESLTNFQTQKIEQVFIIGGAMVYEQAIKHPACSKLFITRLQANFNCDTFFPVFTDKFKKISASEIQEENNLSYCFEIYQKA